MRQPWRISLIESSLNVLSGCVFVLPFQIWLLPRYGVKLDFIDNASIYGAITCVSIFRSFIWRRVFERWGTRFMRGLA